MGGIRVLVVAGIRLFREGLAQILDRREGLTVVGMARDSTEALARIRQLNPQIVLLDMADAESHAMAREFGNLTPQIRVVGLGVTDVEGNVLACAEAGVAEYVPREGSIEDLVASVRRAARGEVHCSPQLAGSLWRRLTSPRRVGGVSRRRALYVPHLKLPRPWWTVLRTTNALERINERLPRDQLANRMWFAQA